MKTNIQQYSQSAPKLNFLVVKAAISLNKPVELSAQVVESTELPVRDPLYKQ
jgi:hypothetical protein